MVAEKTRQELIQDLRRDLLRRRRDLIQAREATDREYRSLAENPRPPEYEEEAALDSTEFALTRLSDAEQQEVARIDAAIARMDANTYGLCLDCGAEIPSSRLEALPYALRDADCADAREEPGRKLFPRRHPGTL